MRNTNNTGSKLAVVGMIALVGFFAWGVLSSGVLATIGQ